MHVFDLSLYKWTRVPVPPHAPQPAPRSGCQLLADGTSNSVLLFGGYYKKKVVMQQFDSHKEKAAVEELAETGHEFCDLWRLDLESGAWDSLKARHNNNNSTTTTAQQQQRNNNNERMLLRRCRARGRARGAAGCRVRCALSCTTGRCRSGVGRF